MGDELEKVVRQAVDEAKHILKSCEDQRFVVLVLPVNDSTVTELYVDELRLLKLGRTNSSES